MAHWLDDFMFYLPGFASVPIAVAGMLGLWLVWRLIKPKKKPPAAPVFPPFIAPTEQGKTPVEKPLKR